MRIASVACRKPAWPSHNISVFDQCKSKGEEKSERQNGSSNYGSPEGHCSPSSGK